MLVHVSYERKQRRKICLKLNVFIAHLLEIDYGSLVVVVVVGAIHSKEEKPAADVLTNFQFASNTFIGWRFPLNTPCVFVAALRQNAAIQQQIKTIE